MLGNFWMVELYERSAWHLQELMKEFLLFSPPPMCTCVLSSIIIQVINCISSIASVSCLYGEQVTFRWIFQPGEDLWKDNPLTLMLILTIPASAFICSLILMCQICIRVGIWPPIFFSSAILCWYVEIQEDTVHHNSINIQYHICYKLNLPVFLCFIWKKKRLFVKTL